MHRVRADKAAKFLITLGGGIVLLMLGSMIWHLMKVATPLASTPTLSIEQQIPLTTPLSIEFIGDLMSGGMALSFDEHCHLNAYQLNASKQQLVKIHSLPFLCSSKVKLAEFRGKPILFHLSKSGHLRIDQLRLEKQRINRQFMASMLIDNFSGNIEDWQVAVAEDQIMIALEHQTQWQVLLSKYGVVDEVKQLSFDVENTIVLMPRLGRAVIVNQDRVELHGFNSKPPEIFEFGDHVAKVVPVFQDHGFFVSLEKGQLVKWLLVNKEGTFVFHRSFVLERIGRLKDYWQDEREHLGIILTAQGTVNFINSVSGEKINRIELESLPVFSQKVEDNLYFQHDDHIEVRHMGNKGAAINLSSLWDSLLYTGYQEPAFVWQSASSEGIEPKYSLIPLVIGSIKSAFYALVVAVPLSLGAAIYSGYFLSTANRRLIKPTIELLEAIPSVVIGFLLSVWLISWSINAIYILLFSIVFCPFLLVIWSVIQHYIVTKRKIFSVQDKDLWPIVGIILLAILLGYFAGSFAFWDERGGELLQLVGGEAASRKNTLVVAVALGIAITPTIYTLAEDAIYDVPLHYQQASFALGATQLQTLQKVVLKVALPGLVSAVMLGFGRAFGETMIVLMVTGNTPVSDWGLLSGLRTLGANLAIELPHSEVGSGLYRVLFLTALLLFFFTFVINTIAESIRSRFYSRYDNV